MFLSVIIGALLASVDGQSRIAGGQATQISEYPFSASLLTNAGAGSYRHACGGTILREDAILSAASCFFNNQEAHPVGWWRVRVGSTASNTGGTTYLIRRIIVNPDFNPTTLTNDIAVLRTSLKMTLVPGSVEVARVTGAAFTLTTNQVVRAIGWGTISNQVQSPSAELRVVDLFVVNQQTCTNRYHEIGYSVTSEMVCAGWQDVGVIGQCQGDSGSPLLNNRTVVGVFSWAEGCAHGWYPAINTRLTPYLSWMTAAAYA